MRTWDRCRIGPDVIDLINFAIEQYSPLSDQEPLLISSSFSTTMCQRSRVLPEFALCLDMKLVDEFDKALLDKNLIRPSVNRAYYVMFYAVLAVLAQGKKETSKHSGVIAFSDGDFVKLCIFKK